MGFIQSKESWFYLHCVTRLTIIILIAEIIAMMIFSVTTVEDNLSPLQGAILDGVMLILFSIYPLYRFVYTPILNRFQRDQQKIQMLAEALQGAGESVVITRPHGEIIYVNQAFSDVTGYSYEEAIGQNPSILKSGRQDRHFYDRMWHSIRDQGQWKGELWNRRKNGELYPESLDIRSISDDQGKIKFFVGVFSDLTEQKRVENALLQSQKLEAIGTLVGGVAHNFNNLLAAISGKAHVAAMKLKAEEYPLANGILDEIQDLSFDASHLVKQLLTFARESKHDKEITSLTMITREAVDTARIGISEEVDIEVDIPQQQQLNIFADALHIKQAIINLINNARDAVSESETKLIRVRLSETMPDDCEDHGNCNIHCKHIACLEIEDTGSGINSSDIDKVFEPFFTTKEVGKGTGLGLSTAHGIISSHNGSIQVNSTFSKGTTFKICLPLTEEQGATVAMPETEIEFDSDLMTTILVADDAKEVRQTVAAVLESFGHQVIQAENGVDALNLYNLHQQEILLVISDIVMPKMDGVDCVAKMRERRPKLPVIFMTGYDAPRERSKFAFEQEHTALLNKPFKSAELSQMVNRLIHTQQNRSE